MCDTLAVIGRDRTLFAKNSDRPVGEVQLVEALVPRAPGETLKTQYLEIPDEGAAAVLGSRPDWLWGLEHGVNEHRVAVGNEKVWTIDDPYEAPPALIGMDLVRLGLERGTTAAEALEAMTELLEEHGQGGVADASADEPYWSSFLIADPREAYILETSGTKWASQAVDDGAAISNRVVLPQFDEYRNPHTPTGHADRRLEVTRSCVATGAAALTPSDLAHTMRDHGGDAFPPEIGDPTTGEGVTVCMHLRGYQTTAASMLCELPADPSEPARAWVAVGSPCVSVYLPAFPPATVARELADPKTWHLVDRLRQEVEKTPERLPEIRAVLDPVERELWAEADDAKGSPEWQAVLVADAGRRTVDALQSLA